jgi:hypothetical protein
MRQAREYAPEVLEKFIAIVRNPDSSDRDVIQAGLAILDRGCGKAITPVYQGEHGLPLEMIGESGADGETTPLLRAAKHSEKDKRRKELLAELGRLDREERTDREIRDSQMTDAREAALNGEPVSDMMSLLLAVKSETE